MKNGNVCFKHRSENCILSVNKDKTTSEIVRALSSRLVNKLSKWYQKLLFFVANYENLRNDE